MTKIKFCGLTRPADIEAANRLRPDYIGFVFAPRSRRFLALSDAKELKKRLHPSIRAVGVFVNEEISVAAGIAEEGTIDVIQLHGGEDTAYIRALKRHTSKPVIQAFCIRSSEDIFRAEKSEADMILLDAGAGEGRVFDWDLIGAVHRPYFLAGGLNEVNAGEAVHRLKPYALDVSSGIETQGKKDEKKMAAFLAAVRDDSYS